MINTTTNSLMRCLVLLIAAFSIATLFNTTFVLADTKNNAVLQELMLIFTADYGQGEQVYSSNFANDSWTVPLQLSDSLIHAFHPVVAVGDDNYKWAVWTQVDENGKYLYYSVFNGVAWSKGKRISTQTTENSSPALMVNGKQNLLLAWVGVDDKYSDVYLSHWQGSTWTKPVMINAVNNVPDIKPYFSRNMNNRIVLSWLTFIDGKYAVTARILDDEQRVIAKLPLSEKITSSNVHKRVKLPALPEFVKDVKKGSFFIKTSAGSASASLSDY